MPLKTLIFDLGNVIVPFDFMRAFRRFEQMTGQPPESVRERLMASQLHMRLESGQMGAEDFVREVTELLDAPMSMADFSELWYSIFDREALIPESLFERLRSRYRLLLLSNTNAIHFGLLRERFPHFRHFHHLVLSHEVKAMKPEPAIFHSALANAHAEPGECFFTDDIADYVEGARRHGIDAEQFLGLDKLLGDLRRRGVDV